MARRCQMRRSASGRRRRCSTPPQRSTLRKTGPKPVSELRNQSSSARTGQAIAPVTRLTTTTSPALPAAPGTVSSASDVLSVQRKQAFAAQTRRGEQQQGTVAQAGEIARAARGHAGQLGGTGRRTSANPRPWRSGVRSRRLTGDPRVAHDGADGGICRGRGLAVAMMLVGDGGGAPGEGAMFQRRRRGEVGGNRRGRGWHGDVASLAAPNDERGPVRGVEPPRLCRPRPTMRCRSLGPCAPVACGGVESGRTAPNGSSTICP